jgi:tripartite-type tricarboxylate transporter receptor subunit TctC
LRIIAATLALTLVSVAPLHAQDYPVKPVRIVVPNPPGGANDILGRMVADKLRDRLGQPVLVENRAGAAGNVGAEAVYKSPADGYTFLITTPAPLVSNKSLYKKLAFDPDQFTAVSIVVSSPNVLVLRPGVPASNVRELIAYAKANPDKLNYATQGAGTGAHLTAELMKMTTGIGMVHVPYKGSAPALADMLGGNVDVFFVALGDALPFLRSGKLKAIAVGSERRNSLLPDLAPIAETLPGFVSIFWQGMVAPPGTPAAIVNRISAAVADGMKQPDLQKRLTEMSIEVVGSTPAEMDRFMNQERERWSKVIRATGASAE